VSIRRTSRSHAPSRRWREAGPRPSSWRSITSQEGPRRSTLVHPYFLEPDAALRTVYLIGFDESAGALRTFKIERIRSATLTTKRYEIPEGFDPDRYLAHSWGIWSSEGTPTEEVRLRFDASVARRVREAVWHRSQRLVELPEGGVELTFTVAGIVEIRPWVLSWGDGVEVLAPASLRESVALALGRAAERYGSAAARSGG